MKKGELEKVELANDILQVIDSVSTQDRIDILQMALDSMLAKKQLNSSTDLAQGEKEELKDRLWYIRSLTELDRFYRVSHTHTGIFSCTCPDFQFRAKPCKHIQKVKRMIAGENQKNKLPGVDK